VKAVILAGGLGTRISEETSIRPKPMVEIGSMPIIWHIMKTYEAYGVTDFIVLCGYKSQIIKDFFINYAQRQSSIEVDMANGEIRHLTHTTEKWNIKLIDTGEFTMTGGRLKRAREYLNDETFFLTYGDGVSNIDLNALHRTHQADKSLVTLTAIQPPGRFGALVLGDTQTKVTQFQEKPENDGAWINGGYFVVEPEALDFIAGDNTTWEQQPLVNIAQEGKLSAYKHRGFWQAMDTLRDRNYLESLWLSGEAPWKTW